MIEERIYVWMSSPGVTKKFYQDGIFLHEEYITFLDWEELEEYLSRKRKAGITIEE